MGVDEPTPDRGSQAISTKLDAAQLAQFELAVAASGLSRAAFIRAAVLRQGSCCAPTSRSWHKASPRWRHAVPR